MSPRRTNHRYCPRCMAFDGVLELLVGLIPSKYQMPARASRFMIRWGKRVPWSMTIQNSVRDNTGLDEVCDSPCGVCFHEADRRREIADRSGRQPYFSNIRPCRDPVNARSSTHPASSTSPPQSAYVVNPAFLSVSHPMTPQVYFSCSEARRYTGAEAHTDKEKWEHNAKLGQQQ